MLREFKAFIARGNVLDLAVAVIIGSAFNKIVTSLTEDVLMPVIGRIFGGLDFSSYFVRLGAIPDTYKGPLNDYGALKKAGVPLLGYGEFVTQIVNFLIVAFIIFLILRAAQRMLPKPEPVAVVPVAPSEEVVLLRDIRDALTTPRSGA